MNRYCQSTVAAHFATAIADYVGFSPSREGGLDLLASTPYRLLGQTSWNIQNMTIKLQNICSIFRYHPSRLRFGGQRQSNVHLYYFSTFLRCSWIRNNLFLLQIGRYVLNPKIAKKG
jgi:hypothetical protein